MVPPTRLWAHDRPSRIWPSTCTGLTSTAWATRLWAPCSTSTTEALRYSRTRSTSKSSRRACGADTCPSRRTTLSLPHMPGRHTLAARLRRSRAQPTLDAHFAPLIDRQGSATNRVSRNARPAPLRRRRGRARSRACTTHTHAVSAQVAMRRALASRSRRVLAASPVTRPAASVSSLENRRGQQVALLFHPRTARHLVVATSR